MTTALIVAAVLASTVLASMFMWWATRRSAIWAMAGGSALAFVVLIGAVVIAYFIARAAFGP